MTPREKAIGWLSIMLGNKMLKPGQGAEILAERLRTEVLPDAFDALHLVAVDPALVEAALAKGPDPSCQACEGGGVVVGFGGEQMCGCEQRRRENARLAITEAVLAQVQPR